jgi:protein-disulfide isomerase
MRKEVKILAAVAVLVVVAGLIGANYYRSSKQNAARPVTTSNKPEAQLVRPDSPTLGRADAKVTLVEFYDPECESCAAFHPVVEKILEDYDGNIRYVSRYMPLHPNSLSAATFIEAAGEQGKHWQAKELLFRKQPEWGTKHGPAAANTPPPNINVLFEGYAKELGLDLEKAAAAVQENRYAAKIDRDRKDGQSLGVRRTPTFFVNGRELMRFGEPDLRKLIDQEMAK